MMKLSFAAVWRVVVLLVVVCGSTVHCIAERDKVASNEAPKAAVATKEVVSGEPGEGQRLTVDAAASRVGWVGKKVTGQHNGAVPVSGGHVVLTEGVITSGRLEMDMTGITCEDIKNPKSNAKLVRHLKDDDFFAADKFPTANFTFEETTTDGENYVLKGMLTIKGIAHSVEVPVKIIPAKGSWRADGKVMVDRTRWGITYKSGKFFKKLGDKIIYDEFELELQIVAR